MCQNKSVCSSESVYCTDSSSVKYDNDVRITLNKMFLVYITLHNQYFCVKLSHVLTVLKVTYDSTIILLAISITGCLLFIIIITRSFFVSADMLYHSALYLRILRVNENNFAFNTTLLVLR